MQERDVQHDVQQRDVQLVHEFVDLAMRLRLRDIDLAAATGLSIPTARFIRLTRTAPHHHRCIEGIRLFVDRNRHALSRADVRLAA